MHREWGQPITDEQEVETRASWQWDGPVLQNLERKPASRFHWGLVETLVWIATRDMRSVEGALGYLARQSYMSEVNGMRGSGCATDFGQRSRVIIETYLPGDVSGHAQACSPFLSGGCQCGELDRVRFCRCSQAVGDRCRCLQHAMEGFFEAVHGGMPLIGIRDGEREPVDVPSAALAAAALIYAKDGLRLLPNFATMHIPVAEVLQRWPVGFEDRPQIATGHLDQPSGTADVRASKLKKVMTLTRFRQRAEDGLTKYPKRDEVRLIFETPNLDCGDVTSIDKWIRPYHKRLFVGADFQPSAVAAVMKDIEAALEADRQRRIAANRERP